MGRGEGRPGRTTNKVIRLHEARWLRSLVLDHRAFWCAPPPGRPPAAERGPDRPGDQRRRPKAALDQRKEILHSTHMRGHELCMSCVTSAALPIGTSASGSDQTRAGTFCRFDVLGVMTVQRSPDPARESLWQDDTASAPARTLGYLGSAECALWGYRRADPC